jgi:hypothetical protein
VKLTISHMSARAAWKFIEAVSGARSSKADCRSAGARRVRIGSRWRLSSPTLTVFFPPTRAPCVLGELKKIDRSMPIVAETEQVADRRNFCLNSRSKFSDGSGRRFFAAAEKFVALDQCVTMTQNDRVGVRGGMSTDTQG